MIGARFIEYIHDPELESEAIIPPFQLWIAEPPVSIVSKLHSTQIKDECNRTLYIAQNVTKREVISVIESTNCQNYVILFDYVPYPTKPKSQLAKGTKCSTCGGLVGEGKVSICMECKEDQVEPDIYGVFCSSRCYDRMHELDCFKHHGSKN